MPKTIATSVFGHSLRIPPLQCFIKQSGQTLHCIQVPCKTASVRRETSFKLRFRSAAVTSQRRLFSSSQDKEKLHQCPSGRLFSGKACQLIYYPIHMLAPCWKEFPLQRGGHCPLAWTFPLLSLPQMAALAFLSFFFIFFKVASSVAPGFRGGKFQSSYFCSRCFSG